MPILLGILAAAGAGAAGTPYWLMKYLPPNDGGERQWGQDVVIDSSSNLYLTNSGPNYNMHALYSVSNSGSELLERRFGSFFFGLDRETTNLYLGLRSGDQFNTAKMTTSGTVTWNRNTERNGSYGFDAVVDTSGNVYSCGRDDYFGDNACVTKYNSSGTRQWQYDYQNGGQWANRIDLDSSNNPYFTSYDGNGGNVTKLDSNGTVTWSRRTTTSGQIAYGIHIDSSDNIYVVGTGTGNNSTWIWKLNTSGTVSVSKGYNAGGSGGGNKPAVTVNDATGNVYVMSGPYFLAFDSSLNLLWQRQLTGDTIQSGGITHDANNLYFVGSYGSDGSNTTRPLAGRLPIDGSFSGLSTTIDGVTFTFTTPSGSINTGPGNTTFTWTRNDRGHNDRDGGTTTTTPAVTNVLGNLA